MNDNSVNSAISHLLNLMRESHLSSSVKVQVNHLLLEFRFLDVYTQCLAKWNEALQDDRNRNLREPKILHISATLGEAIHGLHNTGIKALQTGDCQDWESLASELLEKVQICKPKIREDCLDFLDCPFRYEFSSLDLKKFYSCLSDSLNDLVNLKADTVSDVKIQIQGIKERLEFLIRISELKPSKDSKNYKDMEDFKILIQTWFHGAACLSLLYWIIEENGEEIESRKKIFLGTPRITRMFLAVLKYLSSSSRNRLLMHEGVLKFADFFLEILQVYPLEEDIETLHRRIIFLTTFIVDPPLSKDAESISKEVESLICSLSADEVKGAAAGESDVLVNLFIKSMNSVIVEVRELYDRIFQDPSSFNFPGTDVLGFVDSLLENLKGILEQSAYHEVVIVQKELQWLRPFLGKISKLQNEHLVLWRQIVNVVYRAKIGIQLLLYVNNSTWYGVKCLSDVLNEIKLLKSKINQIQDLDDIKVPGEEKYTGPIQAKERPRIDEGFIGLEDESETLIDVLIGNSETLNIVLISGMPGLGKTSLAKKIYDSPSVDMHFRKRAWCSVSQTYQKRDLFLEILGGTEPDSDFSAMTDVDLEQTLHRSLLGSRYLIVMDDVWDLEAWNSLERSFPDQNNGSRIVFTSRIENVALEAKKECIPHVLRPLNFHESWRLLRTKLFGDEDFPFYLKGIGEKIVEDCEGLPLAIVVIAGILLKKVDDFDWWNHIAENIESWANNVCMGILELSFKHLPEVLKPCFLYFGAFQEDRVIRAQKLIQLWISEGLVKKSEEILEDTAKKYLGDLVARNLVMVAHTSSNGGIKACRIHDLLREFCLRKATKENFLLEVKGFSEPSLTKSEVFKNYRISIQTRTNSFLALKPSVPCVHSLLFRTDYSFYLHEEELPSLSNFKLLHVLDLEEIELNGYFPKELLQLVLLTYLAISCPDGALSVPPSIANLRNLETFRVKRYFKLGNEISLPDTIWEMKSLRHIDVGGFTASVSDDCESTVLDNLQTFSALSLCYGEDAEKLLRRILKVRKLKCQFDDSPDCNQFPVLDSLNELESLNVIYIGRLLHHSALRIPPTLKKLTLSGFKLPWRQISAVAKLEGLEVLKLLEDAFDGETWDLQDDEFTRLKFLKLCNLNIVKWNIIGDSPFPCLEQLIMEACRKLEGIPSIIGEINTLKRIEVHWCNPEVAASARQIQKDFDWIQVVIGQQLASTGEDYVDFNNNLFAVIDKLKRESMQLDIISIVGPGGVGKTTLAKMVFNHPSVQSHFKLRGWCCASSTYENQNLLLDLLSDIYGFDIRGGSSKLTNEELAQKLYHCLKKRRYLIVIDDVWDIGAWNALKDSLPDDYNGSRILFTSRIQGVAQKAKPYCILYPLLPLSDAESWELLQKKLLLEGSCPPALVEVGRQIAVKCNGLPLAICTIAGLLLQKVDNLDWWKQIAESSPTAHLQSPSEKIYELLELSYKNLPAFLKPCFLYFSALGEEKEIRVQRLIRLWISEGFVPKSDRRSREDVAEEYLMDLVSRSLVRVTRRSSTGGIKACRIDGILFSICLKKSEEMFSRVVSSSALFFDSESGILEDYRRVRIQSKVDAFFASNSSGPRPHSLRFYPNDRCLDEVLDLSSIGKFKLLRVFDMEEIELRGCFPEEVTILVHLRYLAIWCRSRVISIPSSIANLGNLETLRIKRDVRVGGEICLPDTFWRMIRLRHVDVGPFTLSFPGDRDPNEEYRVMDNIQTFSWPSLSYGEDAEELLRRLPRIRILRFELNDSCDPSQMQSGFPRLDFLAQLESLNVRYIGRFFHPQALNFPFQLKKLTLSRFRLPWSAMSRIGYLPHLQVLKLLENAFHGEVWEAEDYVFPRVKFLKLCQLNLARWNFSDCDAFPRIEQLIVASCAELERIPLAFGNCPTLEMIQVRGCSPSVADSVMMIEEEQIERGNEVFKASIMDIIDD